MNSPYFKFRAICLLTISFVVFSSADAQENELEKIYSATPNEEDLESHFPVPLAYAEWEDSVKDEFGRESLARFNESLYRDLPPCKAENAEVPRNDYLLNLIKDNPEQAKKLMLQALTDDPAMPQWSILDACNEMKDEDFIDPAVKIAQTDPDKTDRAFAYKLLANYDISNRNELLREGLFDYYVSVRLICMEILGREGDSVANMNAFMPINPQNPFHFWFYTNAYSRMFPGESPGYIAEMPISKRIGLLEQKHKDIIDEYIEMAAKHRDKEYSSIVLYLLGNEEQKISSFDRMINLILEQGKKPDKYWGEDFWMKGEIILALNNSNEKYRQKILDVTEEHLKDYSKEKDQLLISMCYYFSFNDIPESIDLMVKVRDLEGAHPDLYLSAAKALARQRSTEAFPSLISVLNDKRMPFFEMAILTLENLTGLETPGKPDDEGILHNIGVPKDDYKYDEAIEYWKIWYSVNKRNIYYDESEGIFEVKE